MQLSDVLRRPLITEKNTALQALNKYTFEIAKDANKPQVKDAVEKVFKVTVLDVNIIRIPGRMRRAGRRVIKTSPIKKAIVTLKDGDKIQLFEGV